MSPTIRPKPSCWATASASCARASSCKWPPPPRSTIALLPTCSSLLNGRVTARQRKFGLIEAVPGQTLSAWLPARVKTGEADTIPVRPENVRLGVNGTSENTFGARVTDTRFRGTQTVYALELLGGRIDASEIGTLVRYRSAATSAFSCHPTSA